MQIEFDFEPGLTARFKRLEDVLLHSVHTSRQGVEKVAAHLDQAPSELSRRLTAHLERKEGNENNRPLRVCDLIGVLESTEDYTAVFWLIEKFVRDPGVRQRDAISQISKMLPVLTELVKQADVHPARKK